MKAVLVLAAGLFSLSFATSVAQGNYIIQADDEFTAGQEITSVPGVKLTMPTYAQNDDTETPTGKAAGATNYVDADFVAATGGNGGNPKLTDGVWHGTTYRFTVEKDGFIVAGVVLNASKTLVLVKNDTEDILASAKYNLPAAAGEPSQELSATNQVAAKSYGTVTFAVEAGNTYNIHCNGSKMGFFGFKFTEENPAAEEESDFLPTSELKFEGATVLSFSNMGLYGAPGTKANKIIGAEGTAAEDFSIQLVNKNLLLEAAPNLIVNEKNVKAIALPAGEQVVITVPANKLATKLSVIAYANVYDSTATLRPTYFSEINGTEYTTETIDTITSYRNFEHPDTFIVACAELEKLTLTAAGENVAFVAVVETIDNPYTVVEIDGAELLRNGDFETWASNVATYWASVKTTASNGAKLTQSEEAYEGDASIMIGNESSNKRLAYRELKLKKGTYYFSFMAKAVKDATKMPSIQYGFVPSVDGKVGTYVYQDTKTIPSANKWSQYIDTLVFAKDTVINLLVMSKKNTADVLIDNASLKTQNGGLINFLEDFEYADNATVYIYEGKNDTIDYSVAPFGGVVAQVVSDKEAVATAAANASAIIVSALAPGKAAITATLEGVKKTINYTVLELGTGIETEQTVQGAKGVELVGKSYTVAGEYVLGELENGYETFATDVTSDNTLEIKVKKGSRIRSIVIEAGANDEGRAETSTPIYVTGISIDGGDNILEPAAAAKSVRPLNVVTDIIGLPTYPKMVTVLDTTNVKESIVFTFDNTNVKANKVAVFKYTIVYETPEIDLKADKTSIGVGDTAKLTATVVPTSYVDSLGYSVIYESADPEIATVNEKGEVIGVSADTVAINAYLVKGQDTVTTASVDVIVNITINKGNVDYVWYEDYEERDNVDDWEACGAAQKKFITDGTTGNHYVTHGNGASGNRSSWKRFYTTDDNNLLKSLNKYYFDVDFAFVSAASRTGYGELTVFANGAAKPSRQLFTAKNTTQKNYLFRLCNAGTADWAERATKYINEGDENFQVQDKVWYHLTMEVDKENQKLTYIIKQDDELVTAAVTSLPDDGTSYDIQGIYVFTDRDFEVHLDNIGVSAESPMSSPEISVIEGNEGTSKLIRIQKSGADKIYYQVGNESEVSVDATSVEFRVFNSATISYHADSAIYKSFTKKYDVVAGIVPAPTAAIDSAYEGSRWIALANDSTKATFTYDINESGTFVDYDGHFEITADAHVDVIAKMKDVYTDTYFYSEKVGFDFTAGTTIKLDTVLFTRVHFDEKEGATAADTAQEADYAAKELSAWKVYLNPDQIIGNPDKKISLIYVTSDKKDTTDLGTYNSGDTVYHIPYGGVFATAHADGYEDSYGHIFFRPAPKLDTVMWIDFGEIDRIQGKSRENVVLLADNHFTVNGLAYAPISFADSVITPSFGIAVGESWLTRYQTAYEGMYAFNTSNANRYHVALRNVAKGQLVVVDYNTTNNQSNPIVESWSSNLKENIALTEGFHHVFTCTESGDVQFTMQRYGALHSIGILINTAEIVEPSFSIDSAYYNNYSVKVESTGSEECAAYDYYYSYQLSVWDVKYNENNYDLDSAAIASLGYEYAGIDTTGFYVSTWTNYESGYTSKLDTSYWTREMWWTPYQKYEEKTFWISDTIVARAYAWYQDQESGVVIDTIAAGTSIQLARPVITFVGETDTTNLYTITVDNSEVVSKPNCYVWTNVGEIANGDTVAIYKGLSGWLEAQARADGYDYSDYAFRYLDLRESHNEPYTAFCWANYASDTIMPASTADFEISRWARFTSTTLRASGNVYYHKYVEAGFNSIVLPFVPAYVTDRYGNVLEDGVDYKIYNFTAKGNGNATSDTDMETLLTGDLDNYRRTQKMNAYTGSYLFYSEEWREVIFVSNAGVQFRANNTITMAEREEGWQIVANNTFKNQTPTVPYYEVVANPKPSNGHLGSVLVLRDPAKFTKDSLFTIAPFTAVIVADTAALKDTVDLEYAHKGAAIDIKSATLADGNVEVKFSAMPVTYDSVLDEYSAVEGLDLTYTVEMYVVTADTTVLAGTATAKNVEGANYTATIKGGEAGQTVMIVVSTTIQGNDVLVTVLGQAATGIETLTTDDALTNDGPIYNINGIRVDKIQKPE